MNQRRLFCAVVGSLLACCLSAVAQEKGTWRAASKTAQSITGDVAISDEKLAINFSTFVIAQIRHLEPAELGAAFDADASAGGSGNLYRLNVPGDKKFLHKNTLCGSEDTQWMATYVSGKTLEIAFFSGPKMPVFTMDAMENSTDLCGKFSYVK